MEMGLSEVFFPHGNFQGKTILAYRSRVFENELQETTVWKMYFLLNIIILCAKNLFTYIYKDLYEK